ncbi:hypothetical protein HD_0332 [[Haemophilus] ducreyi 35000HP]|uniref:Uncharacterized protein n=1 Tax=Haemophilus ducreyi (strain 35000HP / ATCC 700724) TaxID=233412 RepID=Q7VNY8_HAEDU|nr:hypothetical protein HD_0332 [[Haemophilus] ducreyi 35000HP]
MYPNLDDNFTHCFISINYCIGRIRESLLIGVNGQ